MYVRGEVIRNADPFELGTDAERYWLIVSDDDHPFAGERFIAVSITTTPRERAIAIDADAWAACRHPEASYVSPWSLHSPRIEDISDCIGRVSEQFRVTVLDEVRRYLTPH